MVLNAQLLSQEDRERIHRDTLKILWEVGIKFHSDKALDILKRNGAKIDRGLPNRQDPRRDGRCCPGIGAQILHSGSQETGV